MASSGGPSPTTTAHTPTPTVRNIQMMLEINKLGTKKDDVFSYFPEAWYTSHGKMQHHIICLACLQTHGKKQLNRTTLEADVLHNYQQKVCIFVQGYKGFAVIKTHGALAAPSVSVYVYVYV